MSRRKWHFARGLPTGALPRDPYRLKLFMTHVQQLPDAPGCWLWTGAVQTPSVDRRTKEVVEARGYGVFSNGRGRVVLAHRWLWEYTTGEVPGGCYLDHLCRIRSCVNPAHLQPVTPFTNTIRGQSPVGLKMAAKARLEALTPSELWNRPPEEWELFKVAA